MCEETLSVEEAALQFIGTADALAFERFTLGELTAQQYKALADEISLTQKMAVKILSLLDRHFNTVSDEAIQSQ